MFRPGRAGHCLREWVLRLAEDERSDGGWQLRRRAEVRLLHGAGSVATTRDRSVIFAHNGRPYEAGIGAFRAALRNIPGDLTKQMLVVDAATRQSMLFDFLLTPPESGGAGAKWRLSAIALLSGIAAATSLGGVNYDVPRAAGCSKQLPVSIRAAHRISQSRGAVLS